LVQAYLAHPLAGVNYLTWFRPTLHTPGCAVLGQTGIRSPHPRVRLIWLGAYFAQVGFPW